MLWKQSADGAASNGRLRLILILLGAAVGILLLLFGDRLFKSASEEVSEPAPLTAQQELEAYQTYLESRVKSLCESVRGVDCVTVAVTLTGNFEDIYATETVDGNEEYVIVGSGSGAKALYLTRLAPEIAGIGVVCKLGRAARALLPAIRRLSRTRQPHLYRAGKSLTPFRGNVHILFARGI